MDTKRKAAVAAGVLFIVATVADVISRAALLAPVLGLADPLAAVVVNEATVMLGAMLLFVGAAAAGGIAIAMFPVLRGHGEALAIGSVGFRLIEATFYLGIVVCLLILVAMGEEAVTSGSAAFAVPVTLVLAAREALGQVGVLAFALGATMYYWLFYRSRLVPRWLSAWGLVAIASLVVSVVLVFFGVVEPMSPPQVLLALPIGVQEMVLAGWLIAKGFRPAGTVAHGALVEADLAASVQATAA
ncbi:MAG TPA: DUF4386 domain-containing protein [Candidatus Limnocylindrales bacterium]|nr:DUF4386 domain-containing protein [Candidatus Limnocylindrales bacterium]